MIIERLTELSDEVVNSLGELMVQLASDSKHPTKEYLQEVLDIPNTFLFVARVEGRIIGTFSLVLYKIPTGMKVSVEDVVVDASMRGQKVGEKLITFAVEYARNTLGVQKIDLTSNPSRVAANALYQKIGFKNRETNVYRYELK